MTFSSKLLLAASVVLVSACGGSDSSGGNQPPVVVPAPSPSPTPSPAATPTPSPSYDSFASPTAAFNVQLSTVLTGFVTDYTTSPTTYTPIPIEFRQFGSSISSLSLKSKDSFLITYNAQEQAFDQTDFRPDYEFIGPAFRSFSKLDRATPTGGARSDFLTVYRPDGGTTGRAFEYTTIGQYIAITYNAQFGATRTETNGYWFAGGARTQVDDMPNVGIRSTIGPAYGTREKILPDDTLTGSIYYSANFATGEISYRLLLAGTGFSIPELKGTSALSSTRSRFSGSITGGKYSGQISGAFNGPRAREVGFTFILQSDDGEKVIGVAAGNPT